MYSRSELDKDRSRGFANRAYLCSQGVMNLVQKPSATCLQDYDCMSRRYSKLDTVALIPKT
jgi:hypothetical protein